MSKKYDLRAIFREVRIGKCICGHDGAEHCVGIGGARSLSEPNPQYSDGKPHSICVWCFCPEFMTEEAPDDRP